MTRGPPEDAPMATTSAAGPTNVSTGELSCASSLRAPWMCAMTGTLASAFTFCTSLPAEFCHRQSGMSAGFSTTSSAPAAIASARVYIPSLSKNELRKRTGVGWRAMIRRVASMPSIPGIIKSIVTMSGRSVAVISTASAPVAA